MKYRTFAKTETRVSEITLGCWEMGGSAWKLRSDETNRQLLQTALAHGINSFDTAEGYGDGHSEEIVGAALADRRRDCFIASKVSPEHLRPDDLRRSLEASLRRLRTDWLDLYYIHWPNDGIPIAETMAALEKAREEGLIRAIGVSNFSVVELDEAAQYGRVDAIQNEYSLLQRTVENGLLDYCEHHGISFFSYSSLAKGLLSGAYHFGDAELAEDDFRHGRRLFRPEHLALETELVNVMRDLAKARGVQVSQLALNWLLRQKGHTSAIVGTQDEAHLLENIAAVDIALDDADLARLSQVSAEVLARIDG